MPRVGNLTLALAASLAAHLALVLAMPTVQITFPVRVERVVEVEIAEPEPEPEPVPEPEPPPPEPAEPPEPPPPKPISSAEVEFLANALARRVPLQATPPPAPPPLRLPTRRVELPEPDAIPWEPPPRARPEPLPPSARPQADAVAAPDLSSAAALAETLLDGTVAQAQPHEPAPPPSPPPLEIESEFGLERRVAFAPPLPHLQIQNPADVRIQFWVSPRGEVTNASPIQRGDPALDSAAIVYVKKFRFNPLPPGQEQVQWGTLRVKFQLE